MNLEDFVEIIDKANQISNIRDKKSVNIKIFTNTILHPLEKIVKYHLNRKSISSSIHFSEFNTLLTKNDNKKYDIALIVWELENIFPNGYLDLEKLNCNNYNQVIQNFIQSFEIFLKKHNLYQHIIIKKLNSFNYISGDFKINIANIICEKINNFIIKKTNDLNKINILDDSYLISEYAKNYYGRKLLNNKLPYYSPEVIMELGFLISIMICNFYGMPKKVLIVDCDNTLWNGIIGEDDNTKIFSKSDKKNNLYLSVHSFLKKIREKGILLAIVSKNNYSDVEKFFKKKYIIPFDYFVIKKINWNIKSKNILDISKELNLSTNSFIFLDDSEHEVNEVKTAIKDIDCFIAPKSEYEYQLILKKIYRFFSSSFLNTKEDHKRSELYLQEEQRKKNKSNYSYKDYLKNLNLEMNFDEALKFDPVRLVQLIQKTNQFNLTILRQNVDQFKKKIKSKKNLAYAFSLKDKFGEYGTVGLCQIKIINKNTAFIENFLMSCRVMGRDAEKTFLDNIIRKLKSKKFENIYALYSKGPKNKIVENFYKNNGFIDAKKLNNLNIDGNFFIYDNKTIIDKNKIIKLINGK